MDSWQPNQVEQQQQQQSAARRYNAPPNTSPQHPRDYAAQQPPLQTQQQQQQPPTTQGYQTYHGQQPPSTTSAVTSQAPRQENNIDYMDVQMQDAESYNGAKFTQQQQQLPPVSASQTRQSSYLGAEGDASGKVRYSPMNTTISPQQPQYTPSASAYTPSSTTTSTSQPAPNFAYQQHRQSPSTSRSSYTNASQSYYSQHNPAVASRPAPPAASQSFHHMQQQTANQQQQQQQPSVADPNGSTRFPYPQSQQAAAPPTASVQQPQFLGQPRLQRLNNVNELRPRTHTQPAHRRANPEGGFISPVQALTTYLPATYRICNPNFKYESSRNPRRVLTKPSKGVKNDGYDNEDSDYILYVNDTLGSEETKNRYLILDVLGQGTFGQVVKCQNLKTQEVVAVKVIKNKTAYFNQSMMEVSVLDLLNSKLDKHDDHHILRLKDTFIHKQHLCLVFELLSVNLYELIKQNQFRGLSTTLVRVFAQQLLNALCLLNKARLIHCDLKPENILLKNLESPIIKVIDFGSACDERQTVYTYIQSRFYRSPEVLLGLPYSSAIDMWSLGCIVVELFLGLPLFPGSSEYNQVARITEMLGAPPVWMIEMGKQAGDFFEKVSDEFGRKTYRLKSMETYSKEHGTKEQPGKKYFQATQLPDIIRQYAMPRKNMKPIEVEREMNNRVAFIDFVRGLLCINPMERWSPQQAKMHPFITQQKYTGPFVPPMNLKNNSPLQKSPMSAVEQQQRAEAAQRQKQQQAQQAQQAQVQAQAQAQVQAQIQAQAQAQAQAAAQAQSPQAGPGYQSTSTGYHPQSQTQPPVYNNMYTPPQHSQAPTQPPTYQNPAIQYTGAPQQPPTQQPAQVPSQFQGGLYTQNNQRNNRQRSTTMMDGGIPPQIQRAASMMDPNHPIRLQPSPAYFPPPPGSHPEDGAGPGGPANRQRGRGQDYRRNVVRNLEGTLEDGLFNSQQRWQ